MRRGLRLKALSKSIIVLNETKGRVLRLGNQQDVVVVVCGLKDLILQQCVEEPIYVGQKSEHIGSGLRSGCLSLEIDSHATMTINNGIGHIRSVRPIGSVHRTCCLFSNFNKFICYCRLLPHPYLLDTIHHCTVLQCPPPTTPPLLLPPRP
jgi:hypothetical protein